MKIGIIGTGNVGSALGTRWAGLGHTVMFGARNPADALVLGRFPTSIVAERAGHGEEAYTKVAFNF